MTVLAVLAVSAVMAVLVVTATPLTQPPFSDILILADWTWVFGIIWAIFSSISQRNVLWLWQWSMYSDSPAFKGWGGCQGVGRSNFLRNYV